MELEVELQSLCRPNCRSEKSKEELLTYLCFWRFDNAELPEQPEHVTESTAAPVSLTAAQPVFQLADTEADDFAG